MMIDAPVKPSSHSLSSVLPALHFISVIASNFTTEWTDVLGSTQPA